MRNGPRGEEQSVARTVAGVERRILGQGVQRRGEQRGGIVVQRGVELLRRTGRMLVGLGSQLGARLSGKGGEEHGIAVDRVEPARRIDDQILGLQIAVGPVVGDQGCGQPVELLRQGLESGPVACGGGPVHRLAQRLALDPAVENDVDPFAPVGRRVEVERLLAEPVAVDLPQVAHRAEEAAQGARLPVVPHAEDDGRVPDGVFGRSGCVAAQRDLPEAACEPLGIGEREEVLAECAHGFRRERGTVLVEGPASFSRPDPEARSAF